jgi:hypothetical protein
VINDFQAYNHSLAVAMNFHTLLRKDSVTKMYGSILGVLNKESRKMEAALLDELKLAGRQAHLSAQELPRDDRKELFRTMAGK